MRQRVAPDGETSLSYDLWLKDPLTGEDLELDSPHFMRGGTFAVNGTTRLYLNVTYNYAPHFHRTMDKEKGIRVLYGLTGEQSIPILLSAIGQLGDEVSEDYWEPTEGNAKRALCQLLALSKMRPDGVWDGD